MPLNPSDFDLTDPALYDHWVDDVVRFSDTDLQGHVNNTASAKYVESGRLHFDFDVLTPAADGIDEPFSLILANLNLNFGLNMRGVIAVVLWPCLLARLRSTCCRCKKVKGHRILCWLLRNGVPGRFDAVVSTLY